jgi:hypothetical protein
LFFYFLFSLLVTKLSPYFQSLWPNCDLIMSLFSALLSKIAALRSFSLDKLHYWRESASGMSSLAYFLSKDTVDHFSTLIKPLVYLSMFYFFNNPRSSFTDNYFVLLCLVYCVTGIAYVLAIFLQPGPAQLVSISTIVEVVMPYSLLVTSHFLCCYAVVSVTTSSFDSPSNLWKWRG